MVLVILKSGVNAVGWLLYLRRACRDVSQRQSHARIERRHTQHFIQCDTAMFDRLRTPSIMVKDEPLNVPFSSHKVHYGSILFYPQK